MTNEDVERQHLALLEERIAERTAALAEANRQLDRAAHGLRLAREETLRLLSRALHYRDDETGGHMERMSRYAAVLARHASLDPESIRIASPMHDVGKIAVPDAILRKPAGLTPAERRVVQRHAEVGYELLAHSESDLIGLSASIAWTHHERFDGTGYPRGLAGEEIPLEGRIAAVADVFDALTSKRVYRPALGVDEAVTIMREGRGSHFDPEVLDIFLGSLDEVLEIRPRYPDATPRPQTARLVLVRDLERRAA